jgi:hypothetical protein
MRLALLALVVGLSVAARAADPYEMFITGSCLDTRWGTYGQFSGTYRDGALQPFASYVNSLAEAPGGRVFGRQEQELVEVLPDGTIVPLTGYAAPDTSYVSMVVGANGTIYLMQAGLDFPRILRILEPGKPIRQIAIPGRFNIDGGIDLAADQCTLYYIEGYGIIKRFNVCTETPLPDFASASAFSTFSVHDVRVLPDGGALVAGYEALYRFDAAGTLTRTYAVSRLDAIGLANGGRTAIVSHNCRGRLEPPDPGAPALDLERIDLETGAVTTMQFDHSGATDIVPYRTWTAALGAHVAEPIPTASEIALVALAGALMFAAFLRLR